jgi:NADH-quinone oxidoreductase subunit C
MSFDNILKFIESKAPGQSSRIEGKESLIVSPDNWIEVSTLLKNESDLDFDYLMCISSYDKGDGKIYGVAYNLFSTTKNHYLEVRVETEDGKSIPSVVSLWQTANWHEREAFDMMGIQFKGHPDLKRILLSDDWEGHPLRKKYKEPDYYHGMPVPKDKSYWE